MSGFDTIIANALGTAAEAAGREATYRRDGSDHDVVAIPASTAAEVADGMSGAVIASRVRDWLIKAATLTAAGLGTPKRGDTLTVNGEQYELTQLGDEVWRYSDPGRTWIRVHTRSTTETTVN